MTYSTGQMSMLLTVNRGNDDKYDKNLYRHQIRSATYAFSINFEKHIGWLILPLQL